MHPSVIAAATPSKPAVILAGSGEVVTYAQLDARSNQGAQLLRGIGLQRGDGVALLMENSARFLEVVWAAQRAGLYYTCISTRLVPAEIGFILADSGAGALIADPTIAPEAVAEARALGIDIFTLGRAHLEDARDFLAERALRPAVPIADESAGNDMLYSSGTTGRPKGIRPPLPEGPLAQTNPLTELGRTV